MALNVIFRKAQINHGLEGLCVHLEVLDMVTAVVRYSFTLIIGECFLLLFLFLLFLLIYIYVFVVLSLWVVGVICYLCYVVYYVYIIIYCLSVFTRSTTGVIRGPVRVPGCNCLNFRPRGVSVGAGIKLRVLGVIGGLCFVSR